MIQVVLVYQDTSSPVRPWNNSQLTPQPHNKSDSDFRSGCLIDIDFAVLRGAVSLLVTRIVPYRAMSALHVLILVNAFYRFARKDCLLCFELG